MVVAVAAEPSVGQPPLVVEIAGKICPWTYLPHAVMGEESHLSSSYPWMTYVQPLFSDRDLLFSSGESSLRRLLDLEPRRDLDLRRLERSCLRDRDPLVDVDLWSSSESSSEDEDSSLADRLFRRLSRLERCSSSR